MITTGINRVTLKSVMKLPFSALVILGASSLGFGQASATVQQFARERFGVNLDLPARSENQNFGRVQQTNGSFAIAPTGPVYPFFDPANRQWGDAYDLLDGLPKNAWIRVALNMWEHFPTANTQIPVDYERYYGAIVRRLMFRNRNDVTDGLNIMWMIAPGIPPRNSTNDGWFDNPKTRDWFLPAAANRPQLKRQLQDMVVGINNYAIETIREYTRLRRINHNYVSRMQFQLANEVGAGHPGGSIINDFGKWTGVGQMLEDTTAGIKWRADDFYSQAYLPTGGYGESQLVMPAFSFLTEGRDGIGFYQLPDGTGNRWIQFPGAMVPGLSEVFTYQDEMYGPNNNFGWASVCSRRSFHFRSPNIQWISTQGWRTQWVELWPNGTANGQWETATQYASRWCDELELALRGYARLNMPGTQPVVDITECYLTKGELAHRYLDPSNYQFVVNGVARTPDQIREASRTLGSQRIVNGQPVNFSPSPTRISIFAAIRDELCKRVQAGRLKNLGRIYWENAYTADPRARTGFSSVDPINVYNPWDDFKLSTAEIRTLYGLQ